MSVGIAIELAITEVAAQHAKLPHVVGDVLADVADGSIRTDDDFLIFLGDLCVLRASVVDGSRPAHHPATFVLPLGLEEEHAGFFQLGERSIPEMQVQDLALAGQKVVFDVEPIHGFEMAAQHGDRDQVGDRRGFVAAFFDRVQCL